jgi:hypothetical protein
VVLWRNDLDSDSPICHAPDSFVAASHRNSPSTGGPFPEPRFTNFNIRRPSIRGERARRNGQFLPYDAGQKVYEY